MANIMKILPEQCQHQTEHDCLIEVGEDILSLDQKFETFCYTEHKHFDFEHEIDPENKFFYSVVNNKCNYFNNIIYQKDSAPFLFHFNCGSLGSKFDDLENYISSLTFQFDIIALSETWLKADTNIALYQLSDFYMYRLDRVCRKGGGVAIYVKNTLKHRLLNQMTYVVNDLLECLTIELTDQNNNKNIVTCIYRQPDSSIDDFINNIEKLFRNKQGNTYICGDFNINLFNYDSNNQVNYFLDSIYSLGLFPLITKPTRITSHSATLIDNIFTNIHDYAHMSGIIVCDISDHFPVFTCKKVITHTCKQISMTSYYKVRN